MVNQISQNIFQYNHKTIIFNFTFMTFSVSLFFPACQSFLFFPKKGLQKTALRVKKSRSALKFINQKKTVDFLQIRRYNVDISKTNSVKSAGEEKTMSFGRQWDSRFKIWDEAFEENFYRPLCRIDVEGFTTMDFLKLEEARTGSFRPFPSGTCWGRKWEYGWFRCRIRIPDSAAGERIMLHLGVAPEMLVYIDGMPSGSIDKQHQYVEVTDCAEPGRTYEIYAEGYAGHGPRLEGGGINPRGSVPVPEPPAAQVTIQDSHFGIWNQAMFSAYADYHTLYDLLLQLPSSSLRATEIAAALKQFTYMADFELKEPARTESIVRAAEVLKPLLSRKNGDTAPEFTVFGQSHLDLAWLWTEAETRRKSARTYSNQLAMMRRYPEYRFLLCCPTVLENLKQYYPELYCQVQEKVQSGNFIPEGAVWVESDTNLPGGESLIRQFVRGKRWFWQEFHADSKLAWLPDTFGFSGALPQIMKGCRVPYFATQKLLRSDPECEQFPYNNFWWEGIDGTRILSHIYFENNARFAPAQMLKNWEQKRNQQENTDGMIFSFGFGDGGGGATEIMMETYNRCRDLEGLPRCTMESPVRYFERLEQKDVPEVYYGELYLAWHRGTYTVLAGIKERVRRAEFSLREAEYLAGLLRIEGRLSDIVLPADGAVCSSASVTDRLDALWDILLRQEFHDVLAGTSIERANAEAMEALDQVILESGSLSQKLLGALAGAPAIFNSLSWERSCQGRLLPPCGYILTAEQTCTEDPKASAAPLSLTGTPLPLSGAPLSLSDAPLPLPLPDAPLSSPAASLSLPAAPGVGQPRKWQVSCGERAVTIANFRYTAVLDNYGRIISLRDAETGYEYAQSPLNELRLYQDINIYYDAWEIGSMYEQIPISLTSEPSFSFEEKDGEAIAHVERKEPYFTWKQDILFTADRPEISFRTEVDWHERHRMLKVDFPTSIFTREVIEEIQFGYFKRPTHRSRQYEKDYYETCHHKYAALTDGGNGVALINNCKYGLSAHDSKMSLTLLRAPAVPDMTADQGTHRFEYALYPFCGPFQHSGTARLGYEHNAPVTISPKKEAAVSSLGITRIDCENAPAACRPAPAMAAARSYFSIEGAEVFIETCKPAMDVDNGVILRLYEPMGMAGSCCLTLPAQVKKLWQCNMLEEKQKQLSMESQNVRLSFRAFEIMTLLLEV